MNTVIKRYGLIIGAVLAALSASVPAQTADLDWYMRANCGLAGKQKAGVDLSLEIGQRVSNGLEYGVSVGFFSCDFGKNHSGLFYANLENRMYFDSFPPYVSLNSLGNQKFTNSLSVRAFVSYDLWRFTEVGRNLHISPVFGVGYVQLSSYSSKWGVSRTYFVEELYETIYVMGATRMDWQAQSRVELDLGARVEVDLPHGWGVGGYYRWYCLTQKMSAAGISVTKRF